MQKDLKKKRADRRLEERRIYERAIRAVIAREGEIEEVSWTPSLRINNRTTELTSTDLFSQHSKNKKKNSESKGKKNAKYTDLRKNSGSKFSKYWGNSKFSRSNRSSDLKSRSSSNLRLIYEENRDKKRINTKELYMRKTDKSNNSDYSKNSKIGVSKQNLNFEFQKVKIEGVDSFKSAPIKISKIVINDRSSESQNPKPENLRKIQDDLMVVEGDDDGLSSNVCENYDFGSENDSRNDANSKGRK